MSSVVRYDGDEPMDGEARWLVSMSVTDVDAEYTRRVTDGRFNGNLKVHVAALRYSGLLRLVDDKSPARGVLYLDTELSADTEWLPDMAPLDLLLNNAGGSFSLAAWPENAEAGLLDLWSANLLLGMAMKWWMRLIYVPFKWLTGEPFPADGTSTCFNAMDWALTPELREYFRQRDFSVPPPTRDD